jgi:hypothetical protein
MGLSSVNRLMYAMQLSSKRHPAWFISPGAQSKAK